MILAVETSGRLGSVAIAQGPKLLAEKQFSGPMRHSAEVFPAIVNLLKQFGKKPNQLEQVHISIGPGSFTGLRIAVTLAKTMALANGAKIVAVDTLDCIAANVINQACLPSNAVVEGPLNAERCPLLRPTERLAAILDAKRGQFFIAVYEKTQDASWEKILPARLMTAEEFVERFTDKPIALIGEGLVFYKDRFTSPNACPSGRRVRILEEKFWNPSATNVHRLGWQKARLGQSAEGETSPTGGFADPLALTPNYLRAPDAKVKQV